jgi:hypothetical protein
MISLFNGISAVCLFSTLLAGATLDRHPQWKSDRLPDLYYEVLAASVDKAAQFQAPDGRFRPRLPRNPAEDERSFSMYDMQYIYVPALLYISDHPSNKRHGDKKLLEMALAAGDYLASIISAEGNFEPVVNGKRVSSLDSHRALYCWTEAYGLLESHLDKARTKSWSGAIRRSGKKLAEDLARRKDRPRYTAPFLGTSPNHFGLWATTVWRIGMILGIDEWIELAEGVLHRFVREVAPGGYWAEHDGPTMSYDYLNGSVAGLFWHYRPDPEALKAMRINTLFHMYWATPDGVDIHTVDERNRNDFRVDASWGLFTFCYFPEGRRFARFKLLAALGEGDDPLESLGLAALARIAQDAHYHTEGEEASIPQEMNTYRHTLDRPAVVKKNGLWVYSMSAMISPPSPYNQFFLDRICPISLWHERCRHIIGGGNSKNQPELATFAVKRSGGGWDYLPLDALIAGNWDADTMSVAHEGFSLRLTITPENDSEATISAQAESTYERGDSVVLHLPLRLLLGQELKVSSGATYTLDRNEIRLADISSLSHNHWRLTLPENASFQWPYYTYTPYGPVRVPENIHSALGVVTIPLIPDSRWIQVRVNIE